MVSWEVIVCLCLYLCMHGLTMISHLALDKQIQFRTPWVRSCVRCWVHRFPRLTQLSSVRALPPPLIPDIIIFGFAYDTI